MCKNLIFMCTVQTPGMVEFPIRKVLNETSGAEGVRALGCALEHTNLSWALAGIALRMPIIWQSVQLVMDASGLGPRVPRKDERHSNLLG
jgi:hypothetical protein